MNTAQLEPSIENGAEGALPLVAVRIDTPTDWTAVLCLVAPLRRLFGIALGELLAGRVMILPLADAVFIQCQVRERDRAVDIIRQELRALGYLGIAHIGALHAGADGWICLHGSADKTAAFDHALQENLSVFQFATQITQAHMAAAIADMK